MSFSGMEVVGESRRLNELHQIIRAHCGGQVPEFGEVVTTARLVPEPSNPVDPRAVAVFISGLQVGYIPRGETPAIHSAFTSQRAGWLETEATIGWSRPEVVGVRLTGIDEVTGVAEWTAAGGSRFTSGSNWWVWVVAALVVLAIVWFTVG